MFRGKQIEFPPQQTHKKGFEIFMLLFSVACIIGTIILVLTHEGAFIGPW